MNDPITLARRALLDALRTQRMAALEDTQDDLVNMRAAALALFFCDPEYRDLYIGTDDKPDRTAWLRGKLGEPENEQDKAPAPQFTQQELDRERRITSDIERTKRNEQHRRTYGLYPWEVAR